MKTRRGNLGSALSSYTDEQKSSHNNPTSPAGIVSDDPDAHGGGGGNNASLVGDGDDSTSASTSVAMDFRSRSDTIGSLGLTLDDFRGRSETLGSAADVLADCLGPFPSVLDVNIHALPPDQRQVYGAHQAQLETKLLQHQAQQQQQQQQQQAAQQQHHREQEQAQSQPEHSGGSGGGLQLPVPVQNTKSSNAAAAAAFPDSQPSSHGSTSGFLSNSFGSSTKKGAAAAATAAASASASASARQQQPQKSGGGIAHTPPSALGPASYEAKHFGKRMRAGSISGRLRSASDLEDRGIIDRTQKGIIKDLIISGDDALQSALDRYEKGDKSELESMIKSGKLQSYQSGDGGAGGSSNIDILGDLDLDFLTVGDDLGGIIGHMEMDDAHPGTAGAAAAGAAPTDGIGDLDFNADYAQTEEDLHLLTGEAGATGNHPGQHLPSAQGPPPGNDEGRWRANSLAFGGLLNEAPPQTPADTYANWMDNPPAAPGAVGSGVGHGTVSVDANGNLIIVNNNSNADGTKLTKKQERELKKAAKEKAKREKKVKKEQETREKKARREEKARRRSLSPKRKKDEKPKRRSMSPKSSKKGSMDMEADEDAPKEPTPSGLGLPRSMSDPNLRVGLDPDGLLCVEAPEGWVGAYSPDSRKIRIERFLAKRNHRVWTKKVKYDVRKNFADSRLRVKGRFVKKEDELLMRDLMSLT